MTDDPLTPSPGPQAETVVLTDGQSAALRNLARKQAGEAVDFINIGDARALTELGFAERNREGWKITAEGAAALGLEPAAVDERPPVQLDDFRD